MTLREKIADWLTGGELRAAKRIADRSVEMYQREVEAHRATMKEEDRLHNLCGHAEMVISQKDAYLQAIIARGNTSSPNSTVKAMQKIAREALEK